MELKSGTVQAIYSCQKNNPLYATPVLQLFNLSKFSVGVDSSYRYRGKASDGQYYMLIIFAKELNEMLDEGRVQSNHLIRVGEFSLRPKDGGSYMYVQKILEHEPSAGIIGSPVSIVTGRPSMEMNSKELSQNAPAVSQSKPVAKRLSENAHNGSHPEEDKKRSKGSSAFTEIRDLNPFQANWIIKGRVVSKSDVKSFVNAKGTGKLFSFDMADNTAQVKCVVFSELVDIIFPLVELNKVYTLTHGSIKVANKRFSASTLDYEIMLDKNTEIRVADDEEGTPRYAFNFVSIKDIVVGPLLVDTLGIVKEVFPSGTIIAKATGKEILKRDMIIMDDTGNCRLTVWGERADQHYEPETIIGLKGVRTSEYNGVNLSTIPSSQVIQGPDIPEAARLMNWYQQEGRDIVVEKPRKGTGRPQPLSDIKDGGTDYAVVLASVLFVKDEMLYYESCPAEGCNKKVRMEDNGTYRCERCNYLYDTCNYRYMFTIHIGDYTSQAWATVFDDMGQKLFGMTAREMRERSAEDPQGVRNLVKDIVTKEMQFTLRARDDEYNGELKRRITCSDIRPIDHTEETRRMLGIIEKVQ